MKTIEIYHQHTSIEDRLQTMRAISEPFIFKTAHKDTSKS